MSVGGQNSPQDDSIRRLRRQVEMALEQLASLSGSALPPGEFYQELLRKGLQGIDAPAGAVWLKSPQGYLQQQCSHNLGNIGLDDRPNCRQYHQELLKLAFTEQKPAYVAPNAFVDPQRQIGNLTDFAVAIAPIFSEDNQSFGVIEVFQKATWNANDLLSYTHHMAGYVSSYLRNNSNRKVAGQEQLWTQLEIYSRQVHQSLNPTEVAYTVANEGRRLLAVDRICVGIRHGKKVTVEAVSGADVVEKASTHIRRMRDLMDSVIAWGEKLVYRGSKDETLPPKVLAALELYLADQTPKFLEVLPVRDEREKPKDKETPKPVRSVIMMEMFDPPAQTDLIEQKLDVVAAHSAAALYNAAEMQQVPLKPLWWPLMKVQQGLGGKARFWVFFTLAMVALLVGAMVFVPYQLKLDSKGKLAPLDRHYVFSHSDGRIAEFKVRPNDEVQPGAPVALLFKQEWAQEIVSRQSQLEGLDRQIAQLSKFPEGMSPADREQRVRDALTKRIERKKTAEELSNFEKFYKCDLRYPGYYLVSAPETPPSKSTGRPRWRIITPDFREEMISKTVQPTDPILRVGNVDGGWEIVLKIPQKHIGQILRAFKENDAEFLWVDVLVTSAPVPGYQGKGKLYRRDVSAQAVPNQDDQNESEPVIFSYVRINTEDIPEEYHIDERLLVTDVEVHAKVLCGSHSLGYSLFYGVWEFLYEKIIFFF